jgi:antitoxin ParD1/3/4
MTFYQAGDKVNSLSGNGVEVDYADDGSNESQTLKFTWYIDKNGDIYIRYNDSGATYVMDAGAKQYGFFLGDEKGQDVFYGYMIGTGKAKGDVMQIDLVRYNPSGARKKTRSAATDSVAPSFGKATGRAFMPHAIKKLPRRYKNASEVIRAGLRLLEEEEHKVQILKDAILEGIESGIAKDFNPKTHLESLKAKMKNNG